MLTSVKPLGCGAEVVNEGKGWRKGGWRPWTVVGACGWDRRPEESGVGWALLGLRGGSSGWRQRLVALGCWLLVSHGGWWGLAVSAGWEASGTRGLPEEGWPEARRDLWVWWPESGGWDLLARSWAAGVLRELHGWVELLRNEGSNSFYLRWKVIDGRMAVTLGSVIGGGDDTMTGFNLVVGVIKAMVSPSAIRSDWFYNRRDVCFSGCVVIMETVSPFSDIFRSFVAVCFPLVFGYMEFCSGGLSAIYFISIDRRNPSIVAVFNQQSSVNALSQCVEEPSGSLISSCTVILALHQILLMDSIIVVLVFVLCGHHIVVCILSF